jgi:hypothetical protein
MMNKKMIYIVVAVIVVVLIVGIAGVMLLNNNGNNGTTEPTPTPEPSVTVADATSLQFTVVETTNGASVTYNFAVENVNATDEMIRVDIPGGESGNYSYIVKLGDSTSFISMDDGATWTASDFATDVNFAVSLQDYITNLANWNGHDETYSYTASSGSSIVISAIHVNPTLDAALFATS